MILLNKIIHWLKSIAAAVEIDLLHRRVAHHGYVIERKPVIKDSEIVLENYFNQPHLKNALLSYIIYPFIGPVLTNHSNHRECFVMAEILNELGYNVDIINWDNDSFLPAKKYDLVIDNHNNLARLSRYFTDVKKVFHATNSHWLYQNSIEYGRYFDFFISNGIAIDPPRLRLPGNSVENCDAISMFGNEFTLKTYGKYAKKIHRLPMSVHCKPELIGYRDYSKAKTKFIWLNSYGALLKGLDTILDVFATLPELELFVFGNMEKDTQFFNSKCLQLQGAANIHIMGWADIDGDVFRDVNVQCAWIIGSSFSEGGGGSILNGMAKGLVPIITRSTSIDLPQNTGYYVENNTAKELSHVIEMVSKLPDEIIIQNSKNANHFISTNHLIKNFKDRYKDFLFNKVINE